MQIQRLFNRTLPGKKIFFAGMLGLITLPAGAAISSRFFFNSVPLRRHICPSFTLYGGVLRILPGGDLAIVVPGLEGAYKIRFYDGKLLLFEIRQIRDPLLIIEKFNFQHAGVFRYELFKENTLVEKNDFIIKRE